MKVVALSAPFSATGVCPGNGPLSPLNCFAVANYFPLSGLHWQFQHVLGFSVSDFMECHAKLRISAGSSDRLLITTVGLHNLIRIKRTSHPHYSSWHGTLPIRLKTGEDHSTVCDLVMSWRRVFLPKVLQFQILEIWVLFVQQFPGTLFDLLSFFSKCLRRCLSVTWLLRLFIKTVLPWTLPQIAPWVFWKCHSGARWSIQPCPNARFL